MAAAEPAPAASRCPICGKASKAPFDPFCSARCQDVDLNRWLSGVYRIPETESEAGPTGPDESPADEP